MKAFLMDVLISGAGAVAGAHLLGDKITGFVMAKDEDPNSKTYVWKYRFATGVAAGIGAAGAHALYRAVTHKAPPVASAG